MCALCVLEQHPSLLFCWWAKLLPSWASVNLWPQPPNAKILNTSLHKQLHPKNCIYLFILYMYTCICEYHSTHQRKSAGVISLFPPAGPGDQTQVYKLGSPHLYLLLSRLHLFPLSYRVTKLPGWPRKHSYIQAVLKLIISWPSLPGWDYRVTGV